jgi:TolB-like protein/DNA-binding SARP family transcriptional activator
LRLKTFGAMALTQDDGSVNEAKIQRRQLAVLAILAAEGSAGVTRDRLMGLLWPESEQRRARGSLNMALTAARNALHEDVVTEGQTAMHLNPSILGSDVADFTAALARGDPQAAATAYTGPFLDAVYLEGAPEFERWAAGKRDQFLHDAVSVRSRLADVARSAGDAAGAVAHLRRAAEYDRLSSAVVRSLMIALLESGDGASALSAGHVHITLVHQELGAEPDPGVIELMEKIRSGERKARPPVPSPPPAPPRDPDVAIKPTTDEFEVDDSPSVAVLPFACISADVGDAYFAAGMTEGISNHLVRSRQLRVSSRTTVDAVVESGVDVSAIGARLGVRHVLEGSVQRAGNRVRISARLIRVLGDSHLWSTDFDREMGDFLDIQDEIAHAIAETLQLKLVGTGTPPHIDVGFEAYELYCRGRYLQERRSPKSLGDAVRAFRGAIELEPEYALAHAGLADALAVLVAYGAVPPSEFMPLVRATAQRALALDPGLAEPHAALASVAAMYDWDWRGAETEFRRTLEINRYYERAHMWYANYCLAPQGRLDEAIAELRRARSVAVISPVINTCLGMAFYLARRYDDAVKALNTVLDLDPQFLLAHYFLGRTELERGDHSAAIDALERTVAISEGHSVALSSLGYAYARAGDEDEARGLLQRLERSSAEQYVSAYDRALMRAGLGDTTAALDEFEKAFEERSPFMLWLGVQPGFDALRKEPRIQALLGKMGLASKA